MKTWIWVCSLWVWSVPTMMAQTVTFNTTTDAQQILLGSYVTVSFTLQNGKGSQFKAPNFKDFKIISGPSQSVQTTIINGAMSSEMTFSYTLQPQQLGVLTIGPAIITVNRREMATKPISIEVLKPEQTKNTPKSEEEDYFIRLEPSTTQGYVGQQVVLDYKLYTAIDIGSFEIRSESKINNCFTLELPTFHMTAQREIIAGKEYVTKIIKRVALFPQQSGQVTVDPAIVALGITYEDPNSLSFFFRNKMRLENVQTNPVTLEFKPLPSGAPVSFSGAVGKFNADFSVQQNSLPANSTLTLRLKIQGDGDEKKLAAPILELPMSVELYDPRQVTHTDDNRPDQYHYTREYEYLLVPKQEGHLTLMPSFTFFDPVQAQYQTIVDTIALHVLPGQTRQADNIIRGAPDVFNTALDVRSPKLNKAPWGGWGSWLHTLMLLLPLGAGSIAWIYRQKMHQSALEDRLFGRQRKARAIATSRLALAKKFLDERRYRDYYDELLKACSGYIADKFSVPLADVSKHRILQLLQEKAVPPPIQLDLAKVWAYCEEGLFSGVTAGRPEDDTIYETGVKVLSELENLLVK